METESASASRAVSEISPYIFMEGR